MEIFDLRTNFAKKTISEQNDLILTLKKRELKISSWYGAFDLSGEENSYERINRRYIYESLENSVDDKNFPWFLLWEIVWK